MFGLVWVMFRLSVYRIHRPEPNPISEVSQYEIQSGYFLDPKPIEYFYFALGFSFYAKLPKIVITRSNIIRQMLIILLNQIESDHGFTNG